MALQRPFVFRTDVERGMPPILREMLTDRGWEEYDEAIDAAEQPKFNLFWRTNRFTASQINSATYPYQRINHYPKSSEITKKDHLYRHLRRMRIVHGTCYDFSPITFGLPHDYVKFCQFFSAELEKWEALKTEDSKSSDPNRDPVSPFPPTYICKPSDMSRGRKIFVFRDVGDLTYDCSSVVQKYIERPLLIHGHKVDFRVYVLVTSFQPLRAYIYDDQLARFSVEKYDMANVGNIFSHLTNYSVNKNSNIFEQYKAGIGTGCKWHGGQIREHFAKFGIDWSLMWQRVETLVCYTLLSIAPAVSPVPQCFELYGFDIMFDEFFKPWLIEVNFSPALAVESDVDDRVKRSLMGDMIDTLNIMPLPGGGTPTPAGGGDGDDAPTNNTEPSIATSTGGTAAPAAAAGRQAGSCKRLSGTNPNSRLGPSGRPRRSAAADSSSAASSSFSTPPPPASAASSGSTGGVQYVDAPAGKFRWCFPFSPQTQELSIELARKGAAVEPVLRSCVAEVKKREAKVVAQMAAYADTYAQATGRRMSGSANSASIGGTAPPPQQQQQAPSAPRSASASRRRRSSSSPTPPLATGDDTQGQKTSSAAVGEEPAGVSRRSSGSLRTRGGASASSEPVVARGGSSSTRRGGGAGGNGSGRGAPAGAVSGTAAPVRPNVPMDVDSIRAMIEEARAMRKLAS